MSRSITIPTWCNPYVVYLNGKKYTYAAGATVVVPDEVAEIIENDERVRPVEKPIPDGKVWTSHESRGRWEDSQGGGEEYILPAATPTTLGGVKALNGNYMCDSEQAIMAAYNSLVHALEVAGIIIND